MLKQQASERELEGEDPKSNDDDPNAHPNYNYDPDPDSDSDSVVSPGLARSQRSSNLLTLTGTLTQAPTSALR